jgi:hypothetical protein
LNPTQQSKHLDDGYDREQGLTDHDEERLYEAIPKLWPMGKAVLIEFPFVPKNLVACYKQKKT